MLGIIFKSTLAFCASYIILSFHFNDAYLFEHINHFTGPVGENIQAALSDGFARTWDKTKTMSGQMFTNSEPRETIEDKVEKTQSGIKKAIAPAVREIRKPVETYLEELRKEERDSLSEIIQNS